MSGIFPLRETVTLGEDRGPRLVNLDEEVADEVFDALSSRTTREIFGALHDSPQTASDLAEVTDTSVQNAQYHLEKLVAADLVEVVDTWYSERGTEMKVYAPTDEALVLFAGRDTEGTLRTLLKRVVGVLAVLLPGSAVVGYLADRFAGRGQESVAGDGDAAGGDGAVTSESTGATPEEESFEDQAADGGGDDAAVVEEGDGGGDAEALDSGGSGGSDTGSATDTPTATGEQSVADNATARSNGTASDPETATPDATATPDPPGEATDTAIEGTPTPDPELVDAAASTAGGIDPAVVAGSAFFLGGAFVLAVLVVAWYWRV